MDEKEKPLAFGTKKAAYREGEDLIRLQSQSALYSREETESLFRLATLAHILFPKHIPEPAAGWVDAETGKSNFVTEMIPHDKTHAFLQHWYETRAYRQRDAEVDRIQNEMRHTEEFQNIRNALEDAGFSTRLEGYEVSPRHLVRHPNNDLVYIDFEPAFRISENGTATLHCDPEKLANAVDTLEGITREAAVSAYRQLRKTIPEPLQGGFREL